MQKSTYAIFSILLAILVVTGCKQTQYVSTETLLRDMIDKSNITYYPDHYYSTKQFSSYDRASDKGDTTHHSWFANDDRSFFIRQDTILGRFENVMYDTKGPGSVTRLWITVAGQGAPEGVIRFYIDGSETPVLEGKALDFVGYNKKVGYPLSSALSESAPKLNRGHNLYMPIPYSEQCKITYESEFVIDSTKSQNFYYNVNYRTYEEGTVVESITSNTLDSLQSLIQMVNKVLLAPDTLEFKGEVSSEAFDLTLKPKEVEAAIIEQSGLSLSGITVRLKAEDMEQALRSTIIKISFDNNQTVWSPLGDFFATGHAWRSSSTWRTTVDKDSSTLSSSWIMPFEDSCKVEIENLGSQDVDVKLTLQQSDYEWSDRSMYFGASWHQYSSISTGGNKIGMSGTGGAIDLNYINLFGKGVFVGDVLSIYNPALGGHWKNWWGEGDEKIYVDGEDFPSHFGTGTEDYYGYAWCRPESFNHPFVSQPIGEGNLSTGYTVNSRFRGLDVIHFKDSFRFDMELWHWSSTRVNYAPTTFYYMLPGGYTDRDIDIEGAQREIARARFDVLVNTPDADGLIEGESLKLTDSMYSEVNGYYYDVLSAGSCLRWHKATKGKTLELEFDLLEEGSYDIILGVMKSTNFPTVGFSINGKKAVSSYNSASKETAVHEVKLGMHDLNLKNNILSIDVVRTKKGTFCLDYIKVVKK